MSSGTSVSGRTVRGRGDGAGLLDRLDAPLASPHGGGALWWTVAASPRLAPIGGPVHRPTSGRLDRAASSGCLTEEPGARGHDVTLFASGDSRTSAKLHAVYPRDCTTTRTCGMAVTSDALASAFGARGTIFDASTAMSTTWP